MDAERKPESDAEICQLLLAHSEPLLRYVERHIPARFSSLITPDDILQDVWASAVANFRTFKPLGEDAIDRWLITIAQHKLIDALRAVKRLKRGGARAYQALAAGCVASESHADLFDRIMGNQRTPSREVAADEAKRIVLVGLAVLPHEQRQAVKMRYIDGRPMEEITEALGKSEYAINGLLFRALRCLRASLGSSNRFFSDSADCASSGPEKR